MERLFMNVFNRSISASYLILAVLAVRFLLRKAPKRMRCFLWLLVGIRLLFPFSVESVFSLVPSTQVVNENLYDVEHPAVYFSTKTTDSPAVQHQQENTAASTETGSNQMRTTGYICSRLWLIGMIFMFGYVLVSWIRIRNRVKMAVPLDITMDGEHQIRVYQSDAIDSPFLFGIITPRIYIPTRVSNEELPYVVQHEKAHMKRKDYLIKPAGFLLLAVHWFNPLVWAAYILLCRDIELLCDERVVQELGEQCKKAYSQALLSSAVKRRMITACPIAFGEVGVRERVKNVLNYKKPTFWILAAAVLVCLIVPVCFMTQQKEKDSEYLDEAPDMAELEMDTDFVQGENPDKTDALLQLEESLVDLDQELEESLAKLEQEEALLRARLDNNPNLSTVQTFFEQWAQAFCGRDGKTIVEMTDEKTALDLADRELLTYGSDEKGEYAAFGWSSPWPWEASYDEKLPEPNYRIVNITDQSAEILYYAWVSDPHVTVWRELLTYKAEDDRCVIISENLQYMDAICVSEEFYQAYPDGVLSGTMMDYYSFNGAGETLNNNALKYKNSEFYKKLFQPDTAVIYLLNLLNNPNKVGTSSVYDKDADTCTVRLEFYEDGTNVEVAMIQPYGPDGIWLPISCINAEQNIDASSYIITSQNIDDVMVKDAVRLETLFPHHHETVSAVDFPQNIDLNGDGIKEKMEALTFFHLTLIQT